MNSPPQTSLFHVLRKTLALIDPSMHTMAISLVFLMIVGVFMETLGIGLVFPLIKVISEPETLGDIEWFTTYFGTVDDANQNKVLIFLAIGFFIVIAAKNCLLLLIAIVQSRFSAKGEALLSGRLFNHYVKADYRLHLIRSSADLVNHTISTSSSVYSNAMSGFFVLATESLVVLLVGCVLFIASPAITVGAVLLLVPSAAIIYFMARNRLVVWGGAEVETRKRVLQLLQQSLHSIKEVIVFGRQPFVFGEYEKARNVLADIVAKVSILGHVPRLWIETVVVGGVVLGIAAAIHDSKNAGDLFSVLALFSAAAFRLLPSCNRIVMALNSIRGGTYPVNTIHAEFAGSHGSYGNSRPESGGVQTFDQKIVLENISFTYPGSELAAIRNCNLEIQKGMSIGFAGNSGAGKTTLADIILGLLSPQSGRILVDGVEVSDNIAAWQENIAYVPQSVYLTDDSLRRNVAFCVPDAEIDEDQVHRAIQDAQLETFVGSLPQGLDTSVGDRGVRLSGGQKQRIGIARALYENRQLLVLDEATSSLDTQAEYEIGNAIEKLSNKRTIVIIAHRLSTLRKCHQIAYIEDGQVVEIAPFDELVARSIAFKRTVELSKF